MKVFVLFISFIILSCSFQKEQTNNSSQKIPIETLVEGSHGGYPFAKTIVIKDQEGLQEVYNKINMIRRPGFAIPEIDFEREMVIALFMGEKTSGGFATKVEKMIEKDNELEIFVKESYPKSVSTTVICQPFYFCKVKRSDSKIIFTKIN